MKLTIRKNLSIYITILALAGGLAMAAMLAVSLTQGGVTAQDFETFQAPQTYANELLANEGSVRAILTLDDIFLVLYTATILFLALAIKNDENSWLVGAAVAVLLVTTLLDIHENNEILTFIQMATHGLAPTEAMLHDRVIWSGVKFHSSYLSFFLLAFALPKDTFMEKFLRWSFWVGYLPVGVLVYTFPNPWFSLARYTFMLAGLLIVSYNFFLHWKKK